MAPRDYDDDRRYSSTYDNSRRGYGPRGDDMRSVLERNVNRTGREMNGDFDEEERDRRDREDHRAYLEDREKRARESREERENRSRSSSSQSGRDRNFSTASGVGSDAAMDQDPWRRAYGQDRYRSEGTYEGSQYQRPGSSYGSSAYGSESSRYSSSSESGMTGQHRGKGPRNYKRSNDRIREDINDRFTDDAHLDASEISVEANDGEVTLSGTVPDRQAKRRAEDIADQVIGVTHVQNNLRVATANQMPASQTSYGASASGSNQTGYGSGQGNYGASGSGSYQSQPSSTGYESGSANGTSSNTY